MVNLFDLIPWMLITGIVPLIMLFIPYFKSKINELTLHLMLGASAGILLGISFFDIIPEAYKLNLQTAGIGIALGFLTLLIVEHFLMRDKVGGHKSGKKNIQPFGTLALGGMVAHGLVDGFVIPLGFSAGPEVGIIVGLAIALHQIPDSFVAASVSLGAGFSKKNSMLSIILTALDTPVGIIAGLLFLGTGGWLVPIGMGFAAGTFIFVAAADLIPELQHTEKRTSVIVSIIAGIVLVALLTNFLPI